MRRTRLITIAATLGMGAAFAVGCATTIVAPPPADEPPAANSATGAVQRFAWGFNHKDVDVIVGLLTDDFQLITAGTDSAGNPTRVSRYRRSSYIEALAEFWDSDSTVSIRLDRNLIAFPDTRPGKDPRFHKQVRSSVDVIRHSDGIVESTGNLLFFLTRGDSAAIPMELRSLGVKPDSTRWWLDRLEDETLVH